MRMQEALKPVRVNAQKAVRSCSNSKPSVPPATAAGPAFNGLVKVLLVLSGCTHSYM